MLVGVAIWLTTNSPSTLVDRGNEYLRRGEYKRAIQSYDEALRLDPAYRDAFNARGNATAVLILTEVAFSNRALAFETTGQYDRALQDYDEVMRLDPILAKAFEGRRTDLYKKRTENERSR